MLSGIQLQRKDGSLVSSEVALTGAKRVALYFSAHWCPPCRKFTPILKDIYEEVNENEKTIEVIYVSSDKSEEEMISYHQESHGDWLRVPYDQVTLRESLRDHFGKKVDATTKELVRSGIPCLVVLNEDLETVATYDGVTDFTSLGSMAVEMKWVGS